MLARALGSSHVHACMRGCTVFRESERARERASGLGKRDDYTVLAPSSYYTWLLATTTLLDKIYIYIPSELLTWNM